MTPAHRPAGSSGRRRAAALLVAALAVGGVAGGGSVLALRTTAATTSAASSATAGTGTGGASGTTGSPVWWGGRGGWTEGGLGGVSGTSGSTDGTTSGTTSGASGGTTSGTTTSPTSTQLTGLVRIDSTLTDGEAAGTGMVLTADGRVVTNHHVVEGATSIRVTVMSTGRTYTATYVGGDATADVAVLQLQGASGLTPVTFAASAATTGQSVTAVGDAQGESTLTAAPGTVTALAQEIDVQGDDGTTHHLSGLVELAADIVPGDSGGAVYDAAGQVVAMNVAASSGTRDVTGYAIPAATVRQVVDEVVAGRASDTVALGYDGYLGVGLASDGSTTVYGVVAGGPVDGSGLAAGDTVTSVDGTSVSSGDQLRAAVTAHRPGDRVALTWTAPDGTTGSATVVLGTAPIA
ncbi:S1C family serine protease [Lapillicoccus jejuensis]|uniref:S1C family serine protease n=1 Tax=Lapillicoccus jejuensis TaxID=402171 RepID=UPI00114F7481|nr:trypsin-like peptidase domain-containing protein [Lapillicoccus jejuensis]